jgi:hypothetical protein
MLYSYKNNPPLVLPDRIRLSNGITRTDRSTFTEEEILDAGYVKANDKPDCDESKVVEWSGTEWVISSLSEEQIFEKKRLQIYNAWINIRKLRDDTIASMDWRFDRYNSEIRLGLTPTDNIVQLDEYIQALRDITKQENPLNIIWPAMAVVSPLQVAGS